VAACRRVPRYSPYEDTKSGRIIAPCRYDARQ
jgi:hypothetical protein